LYGVDLGGAVLVHPDGHVAWRIRSNSTEPKALMRTVLRLGLILSLDERTQVRRRNNG
jgi:hypothetical protein